MASSRPVRIARSRDGPIPASSPEPSSAPHSGSAATSTEPPVVRPNVNGSQRAVRLATLFFVVLTVLYVGFILYDRTAPGGSSSPVTNGVLLFTGLFAVFTLVGIVYSVTPAPRRLEVRASEVTVVGRWGRRRTFPPLDRLSLRVVRRYGPGALSDGYVELVEVWGPDAPVRTYLVEEGLFRGATEVPR